MTQSHASNGAKSLPTKALVKSESDNGCRVPSRDRRISCAGCGRLFEPVGPQRYCEHACYSAALRVPIEHRFWSKVNKHTASGCWLWTAAVTKDGYGTIAGIVDGHKRPVLAHRQSWALAYGPIPSCAEVLHRCDVPPCVRPDHLFLGSQQDNLIDARRKGRLDESRPRTRVLTYQDRLDIFNAKGYRGVVVDLARRYDVSNGCISLIRKGRFQRVNEAGESARVAAQRQPRVLDVGHGQLDRLFERVPSVVLEIRGEVR